MNSIIKNTLILTVITLIAGFLLGAVYEITKSPIAAQEEKTKNEAYKSVFSDATDFEELSINLDEYKTLLINNNLEQDDITGIIEAKNGDQLLGHVITVISHEGYGGDINVTVGIASDGTICGVEITSISETAGLGMRANTPEFKSQFSQKKVESFVYSKSGVTAENEIDALSGATITTNAMTNAVNSAIVCAKTMGGE